MPKGPVPNRTRRRRNVPTFGDWQTLPDTVYAGPTPRKPAGLHAHASAVWDTAWRHPAANWWTEPDRLEVVELVRLAERVDREESPPGWVSKRMMEIRDRLGLSKVGRQKLRWLLPSEGEQPAAEQPSDGAESPWGHLRPVADADA